MHRFVGQWLVLALLLGGGTVARAESSSTSELGGYLGVWLPPEDLDLSSNDFLSQGPQPLQVAGDFGLRGGYFFLPYLGTELEAGIAPTATDFGGRGVVAWVARVQLVGRLPLGRFTPSAGVGGGFWAVTSEAVGDDVDPAFHWALGTRFALTPVVAVRADARGTFSEAVGSGLAHGVELLGGVAFTLGRRERAKASDAEEIEERPAAIEPRDTDRDGVEDASDDCPSVSGVAPKGCPPPDADADGVVDASDQCPKEQGPAPTGCPVADADGDGAPDDVDVCPDAAGDDGYGCPQAPAGATEAPAPDSANAATTDPPAKTDAR